MRISIDMPDALMRAAEARAAAQGESLGDLVNRAVARELGLPSAPERKAGRVVLPQVRSSDAAPAVLVTNDDIADAFDAEDIERHLER